MQEWKVQRLSIYMKLMQCYVLFLMSSFLEIFAVFARFLRFLQKDFFEIALL